MAKAFKIKDFPNYYITDVGDVYSRVVEKHNNPNNRITKLVPQRNTRGYLQIGLTRNKKYYSKKIHRLVAETFLPNTENKPQVNHIDGDKTNNNVSNLEWVTASENLLHSYNVLNRKKPTTWLGKTGRNNPNSKPVKQIYNNNIVAMFYSVAEAAKTTGIDSSSIAKCCRGIIKSAGKYQWKYN